MTNTARQYHTASLEGATHLGLLLATYDVLANDIRLAGRAAEGSNIEARCRFAGHANLLLGHLESWVPLLDEPALQTSLSSYYQWLRSELLRLQQTSETQAFEDLAFNVSEMRAVWHRKSSTAPAVSGQSVQMTGIPSHQHDESTEPERHVWSA